MMFADTGNPLNAVVGIVFGLVIFGCVWYVLGKMYDR